MVVIFAKKQEKIWKKNYFQKKKFKKKGKNLGWVKNTKQITHKNEVFHVCSLNKNLRANNMGSVYVIHVHLC